jgi:predicted ATP-grasp superfamily ATP-dependent carboligase
MRDQLPPAVGVALPTFDTLLTLMNKSSFVRLLKTLTLPHPPTRIVRRRTELDEPRQYPYYVKTAFGTASSGVWRVENAQDRERVIATLEADGLLDGMMDILVQEVAPGVLEAAQAIFDYGRLIAFHCYRMIAPGQRGGMAAKVSVHRPLIKRHVETLGSHLRWHGSVCFDYLLDPRTSQPAYVDANPRLVEPMNAVFSGVNLADLLIRLSLGEHIEFQEGRPDVCSHMLIQSLLGIATRGESRGHLLREISRAALHRGIYSRSLEELTPLLVDPPSLLPLAAVVGQLLVNPKWAAELGNHTVADYALTPVAIRTICQL